jgi:hypothetical protein
MPSDVVTYSITIAIAIICIGVYIKMSSRSKIAAYHELGHALVAAHYGAKVYEVSIQAIAAGGVTRFGNLTDETKYPSVMVAGYVAEEIAQGRYPSGHMNGAQYYHDRRMVLEETHDDIAKVEEAIKDAYSILTSDDMRASLEYMVPLLVKRGSIALEVDN